MDKRKGIEKKILTELNDISELKLKISEKEKEIERLANDLLETYGLKIGDIVDFNRNFSNKMDRGWLKKIEITDSFQEKIYTHCEIWGLKKNGEPSKKNMVDCCISIDKIKKVK